MFKIAAGQTIGQYLKRRYLTQIYLTIGSDAYNKLKRTAAVMGCGRYKQKMEHFFGKEIDDDKLQRPLTTEQMRINLFDLENSPYVDRWLKEKICGKRQRVDIGNDVTRLLLLDEMCIRDSLLRSGRQLKQHWSRNVCGGSGIQLFHDVLSVQDRAHI